MSTIRRGERPGAVAVETRLLDDAHLSYEELGVLCYLHGLPEDIEINIQALSLAHGAPPDTIAALIDSLIVRGYLAKIGE